MKTRVQLAAAREGRRWSSNRRRRGGNVEIARLGFGRDFQARWEGWKSPGLPSPPLVAVGGTFPRFPQRVISTATSHNPFSRRSTAGHREILRRFLGALMLVENLLPVR